MDSQDSDSVSLSPTPDQCAATLMETIHPIMQFIRTEMRSQRESSLSVPQFRVLAYLRRHTGASLSEVAEHLGVTRATASTMVDRLVQRGLVDRSADPEERRQVRLQLTQTGSEDLERMRQVTRQKIAKMLSDLSAEELSYISKGLICLSQVFQDVAEATQSSIPDRVQFLNKDK